ncbi:hypothetical protein [Streptomyces sp. NPDC127038]
MGSCGHSGPVRTLTWVNGPAVVPSGSATLIVIPRCSPLDLVRLW